jgi:MFS family permease
MWWSCNVFIPVVGSGLAEVEGARRGLDPSALTALKESWKATSTNAFNVGGLLGTLMTVPVAKHLGRRPMFGLYFLASALAIGAAFGPTLEPGVRIYMYFPIGFAVFGVFGAFTYYLPELFPTRLRGTGAGFCYNAGRILAAVGPVLVGTLARGPDPLGAAMDVLFWVALVPLAGLLVLPFAIETRGRPLED